MKTKAETGACDLDCKTKPMRQVTEILGSSAAWLILAHEKPDGDTIGCAVALARIAARLGKRAVIGCAGDIPDRYRFILDGVDYRVMESIPQLSEDSAIVCVDTSNLERAVPGLAEAKRVHPVINIDHHGDNGLYGAINWVDSTASATGELIAKLAFHSGWGLESDEATALYVALVSDNGNFCYPSTSKTSYECAVALLEAGASPSYVCENLDVNLSVGTLKLWARAFSRSEVFAGDECACFWLSKDDFEISGTSGQNTENLVNHLLRIRGVKIAALCSETDSGVRVSLRTRFPFNARQIASEFGGGGHKLAAGCTVQLPLEEAVALVKAEMEKHAIAGNSGSK